MKRIGLAGLLAVGAVLALMVELTSRLGAPDSPGNRAADARLETRSAAGVADWVVRGAREPDGAPALGERRLVLAPQEGSLLLEFDEPVVLRGLLVQADADDRYRIEATPDGSSWRRIGSVRPLEGEGLRTRALTLGELPPLQGLRLVAVAPGLSVLAAVRAYPELPEGWPTVAQEPITGGWPLVQNLGPMLAWRLTIALLGLAGAIGFVASRRRGGAGARGRTMLVVAGALALLSGWDFFQNARPLGYLWSVQNHWDVYHYYLGARYAPELGYTELYHCTLTADVEDGLAPLREAGSTLRELGSNELVAVSDAAAELDRCRSLFAPERWQAFRADVGWFRSQLPPDRWLELARDHGYNPSPAWAVVGRTVASLVPLGDLGFALLMSLDTLLLLVLWGVAWRSFGSVGAAVGLVFFGTNFAAGHWWTHGAFLRQGWLFLSVLGLCSLRTGRPATAGFLLAWATLLRVFPAFFVVGVLLRWAVDVWQTRGLALSVERRRFVAGGLAAVIAIGGLSLLSSGRADAWQEFVRNTRKHYDVVAVNVMGALSVTAALEAELGSETEPRERRDAGAAARGGRIVLALLFAPLLLLALRREPDWAAAILGAAWIPFVTELGSYYFTLLATAGFLAARRGPVAVGLACLAVAMAALGIWDGGRHTREVFIWSSACILVFELWLVGLFAFARPGEPDATR